MRFLIFFLYSCFLCSTGFGGILDLTLKSEGNGRINLRELKKYKAVAFVFLSPECPLSRNYTLPLNRMLDSLNNEQVAIYAVFSGRHYSRKQIRSFIEKYRLSTGVLYDPGYTLASSLQATITPEAFLLDISTEQIIYNGAIDNWVTSLGKQRKEASAHYLFEAINSQLKGEEIEITKTKAIGCFLEIK